MYRFFFLALNLIFVLSSYSGTRINYIEPPPGAEFVNINNNIIIGFESCVQLNESQTAECIKIRGSKSGTHDGHVIICQENKKIIFKPSEPFKTGEVIYISLTGRLSEAVYRGKNISSYNFFTAVSNINIDRFDYLTCEPKSPESDVFTKDLINPPPLNVLVNNNPAPGYLFTTPYFGGYWLLITRTNGTHYWYAYQLPQMGDFKVQPNGNLTYYSLQRRIHYELNSNYNRIDSFYCGNGYRADVHELRVLNNGHALLMAYDPQIVDMSQIVPGGNPHATVIGLIIQEIDENKNVVFQWRSWDHFAITDAQHVNLLDSVIDYVHGNAIESDNDGNLLISSRHLNEITKINRTTGDIIWRFGGPHNQFSFTNDTVRFTYQHAVRRISNGNITLFDNGNYHTPPFSRAVEYSLNETAMTATLVWQYRRTPSVFGFWGGYVQRLSNGNTLIGWGGTTPTLTEVKPNGTVAYEAAFQPSYVTTYRVYKFDWSGPPLSTEGGSGLIPSAFRLGWNYPNPFNPVTAITYDIPKASQVELTVFDVTGRQLKKLVSEFKQPGSYRVTFDGTQYSSGLYFYRLTAGDFTETKKMILLK